MDFPRLVYKSAETHMLVSNEDEMNAALADGWFESVPEALEARSASVGTATPAKAAAGTGKAAGWGKK